MALMASVQKGDPSAAVAILLNATKQGDSPIHEVSATSCARELALHIRYYQGKARHHEVDDILTTNG